MVLAGAAEGTPLEAHVRPGKDALKGEHRSRIEASRQARITETMDLEAALRGQDPNSPFWDYAVGWLTRQIACCCFVEVHPANTRQVDQILRKKKAVEMVLQRQAPRVLELAETTRLRMALPVWRWLATEASVGIHANTPQARRLREAGLSMPVRKLVLP